MTVPISNAQSIIAAADETLRRAHEWLRGPGQGAGSEATEAVLAHASQVDWASLWLGLMTDAAEANCGVWETPAKATTACLACADRTTQLAELLDAQGGA